MSQEDLVKRSLDTLKEMLQDRRLDVSSWELDVATISDFSTPTFKIDITSARTRIVYFLSKYHKTDVNKLFRTNLPSTPVETQILVMQDLLTSSRTSSLLENIEVFRLTDLVINISRHSLQPKFDLMKPDQVKQVLEFYKTTLPKMPVILSSDPIAKYFGLKNNDLLRITRKTPSGGTTYYYRCCHSHKTATASSTAPMET